MKLLTWEINACVDGLFDADPQADVIVWDGHGNGGIDILEFHPKARLIARGPIRPPYHLDSSFAALLFVGQHAMAGTPNAPLAHTYSSRTIEYYTINGTPHGEFGCRAAMAGNLGVPTIFISGDDKAVAEARAIVPNIVGVATKTGLGHELALHLSPKRSQELIREGAAQAVQRRPEIKPFVIPGPYTQEIRVLEGVSIDGYLSRGWEKVDDRTVRKGADDLTKLSV
jgi:D-amino peptidase